MPKTLSPADLKRSVGTIRDLKEVRFNNYRLSDDILTVQELIRKARLHAPDQDTLGVLKSCFELCVGLDAVSIASSGRHCTVVREGDRCSVTYEKKSSFKNENELARWRRLTGLKGEPAASKANPAKIQAFMLEFSKIAEFEPISIELIETMSADWNKFLSDKNPKEVEQIFLCGNCGKTGTPGHKCQEARDGACCFDNKFTTGLHLSSEEHHQGVFFHFLSCALLAQAGSR